jgi:membrane fusion protein, multidrug efflux system
MRQITIIVGVILIIGSVIGAKKIIESKKVYEGAEQKNIPIAFFKKVTNKNIPISITEQGRLLAKKRINLYAEVQGIMKSTQKDFKAGSPYKKGEVMIKITNDAFIANLLAQKSILQNLITSVLPDMRMDYPDAYQRWADYIKDFNINEDLALLPETSSEKEKFFITGKNIYTTYYNTKNIEITLGKYDIKAPFNGILTTAFVDPGTLIRPGQLLGEYIEPNHYEMQVDVSKNIISTLEIGEKVSVYTPANSDKIYQGQISRINGKIDQSTQTVQVFIDVNSADLKEGMYLEAEIPIQESQNAYEVNRMLLVNQNNLFVVTDSTLVLKAVTIIHKNEKTVIVSGLEDGTLLVDLSIPNAYQGMKIAPKSSN